MENGEIFEFRKKKLWPSYSASKMNPLIEILAAYAPDVGGQHCPDSVRIYCAVSVGQNQVQIRNPDTRKPSRLKISDFDGQTPYSKPGQNPDSAFRRRLMSPS